MIEIGSVITGRIERIEPYGVFLKYGAETVFVDAANLLWRRGTNPLASAKPGDDLRVVVLRYNYRDRITVASLKHAHPEDNPYREVSRLPPGTVLRGKVECVHYDSVSVRLDNGAMGLIPKVLAPANAMKGNEIDVVISSLEVESGDLRLEPL